MEFRDASLEMIMRYQDLHISIINKISLEVDLKHQDLINKDLMLMTTTRDKVVKIQVPIMREESCRGTLMVIQLNNALLITTIVMALSLVEMVLDTSTTTVDLQTTTLPINNSM